MIIENKENISRVLKRYSNIFENNENDFQSAALNVEKTREEIGRQIVGKEDTFAYSFYKKMNNLGVKLSVYNPEISVNNLRQVVHSLDIVDEKILSLVHFIEYIYARMDINHRGDGNCVFERLFDQFHEGLYIKDADSKIISMNKHGLEYFGLKHVEDIKGRNTRELYEIFGIGRGENLEETIKQVEEEERKILEGEINNVEYEVYREHSTFMVKKSPFRDLNGKIIGLEVYLSDITERRKSEDEVNRLLEEIDVERDLAETNANEAHQLNIELEESNRYKDSVLAVMGHDLRGPNSSIISLLTLLIDEYESFTKEEILEYMGHALHSAEGVNNTISDILEMAKLERDMVEIESKSFNLKELILSSRQDLKDKMATKGISFVTLDCGVEVVSDPKHLKIVLRNLLSNAVKFSPKGGRIAVSYKSINDKQFISVSDNGIGMDEELMGKIFTAWKARSRAGVEGEAGNGLALPICKMYVDKCGGRISVESEVGKGSIFTIELPIVEL